MGAGIVGLAVARELALRDPRRHVVVLEQEERVATHQTCRNSGVVHAGIYYAPGSLKATLCVAGARELAGYCEARGLAYERCGKLIVALDRAELPALDELERRGAANGVPGLRRLDAVGMREIEPHAAGIAALHSPATAIADFAAVARAFADDLRDAGGEIHTNAAVAGIELRGAAGRGRRIVLRHARGELAAGFAVFCAGAASDRLALLAGAAPDPRIVPFRGAYIRLLPSRRELVRGLIYPVPDPRLPFLGVHLTRQIGGEVLIGPSALLAPHGVRGLVGDVAGDREGRGGGRGRRVADVQRALRAGEGEVVEQPAVPCDRLRPHPGPGRLGVAGLQLGDVARCGAGERRGG